MTLWRSIRAGALLGLTTGFVLSILYTVVYIAVFVALTVFQASQNTIAAKVGTSVVFAAVIGACGLVIGVVPGIALGAVTGAAIGLVVFALKRRLSSQTAILAGSGVSLVVVLTILLIYTLTVLTSLNYLYSIPAAIYIIASGWMGRRLYLQMWSISNENETPTERLSKLDGLKAAGLITDEEYDRKREEILGTL